MLGGNEMKYMIQFLTISILVIMALWGLNLMEGEPDIFWNGFAICLGSLTVLGGFLYKIGFLSIEPYLSTSIKKGVQQNERYS